MREVALLKGRPTLLGLTMKPTVPATQARRHHQHHQPHSGSNQWHNRPGRHLCTGMSGSLHVRGTQVTWSKEEHMDATYWGSHKPTPTSDMCSSSELQHHLAVFLHYSWEQLVCIQDTPLTAWSKSAWAEHGTVQVPPQSTPSSIPLCTPSLQDARAPGRKMHAVPRRRKRGSHWVQASPLYPAAHRQYPDVLPTHTPWPAHGCRPSQQHTHTQPKRYLVRLPHDSLL